MKHPPKNKLSIAEDNNNCVIGSVDGVKIAPKIVDPNTIYFQAANMVSLVTIPDKPTIN